MGTPLNQFVRRLLSPNLAPKQLFASPKSPSSNNILQGQSSASNFVRKLNFLPSPNKDVSENLLGLQPFYGSSTKLRNVKIGISSEFGDSNCQYLVVDTPERSEILKSGLADRNLAVLGKGHFGTVVQAKYKGETVVVKIINLKNNSAQSESNALGLKHENVVETIKIVMETNKNFGIIIMRNYPDAKNVHDVLHNEQISISKSTVLKWAQDISKGLEYCHKNDILHLDLKPKNVLVAGDEICRICDFGNSLDVKKGLRSESLGTVGYTAPELFRGESATEKSDIYSLGITFCHMESRKVPYENINCKEVIIYEVVKNGLRPKHSQSWTDFSNIYESCWVANPIQRPTIFEINEEINYILYKCETY